MSNEINDQFPVFDRSAMILEPTAHLLAWVKASPGDPFEQTLDDIQADCSVYLIPVTRDNMAWLRRNYKPIFEQELFSWFTKEAMWPKDRSFKNFCKFFRPHFHSMVTDLGKGPIYVGYE